MSDVLFKSTSLQGAKLNFRITSKQLQIAVSLVLDKSRTDVLLPDTTVTLTVIPSTNASPLTRKTMSLEGLWQAVVVNSPNRVIIGCRCREVGLILNDAR